MFCSDPQFSSTSTWRDLNPITHKENICEPSTSSSGPPMPWALLPSAAALAYVLGATSAPGAVRVGFPLPALVMQADGRTVVGAHTHAKLHHIDVPSSTAAAAAPPADSQAAPKKARAGKSNEGGNTHASLHHIDVPSPTAAAAAPLADSQVARKKARGGNSVVAGRSNEGGNTHANLHHIDVPSPTAAAAVPDDANNILGKKEQRGAKQETRMQEPIAGEFTHANLHHIDVPKAGR